MPARLAAPGQSASHSAQRGGVAIEFALVFPLFFTLFYAIVGYGLVMTLEQSLALASKEGARAAIAVDPTAYASTGDYQAGVIQLARGRVYTTLTWLPDSLRAAILGTAPGYDKIQVSLNGPTITVTLTYPYTQAPLLPILNLPVIGKIPNVPDNLVVRADAQL